MGTVNVAELKDKLSAYLHRVRAGEEIVIRDRNLPVAKIVPLGTDEMDLEEASLVASGQMTLPKKQLDVKRLLEIGSGTRPRRGLKRAIRRAVDEDREENDAGLLGHKRHHPHLRSRTSK